MRILNVTNSGLLSDQVVIKFEGFVVQTFLNSVHSVDIFMAIVSIFKSIKSIYLYKIENIPNSN